MQSYQDGESSVTSRHNLHPPRLRGARLLPLRTGTQLRRPVALSLAVVFLFNLTLPIFTQEASAASSTTSSSTTSTQTSTTSSTAPVSGTTSAETLYTTSAATSSGATAGTFSVDNFHTDQFTGAASAEIPIVVAPGTAGVAPQLSLRYNSVSVDEMDVKQQASGVGLGWSLDAGGFILRDTKNTADTADDAFKLVFGGKSHELVRVDATQNIYHTKDETFWRIQYYTAAVGSTPADSWTLTTKDGTLHRFGSTPDSKAVASIAYKYLLAEVQTTRGTGLRYSYTVKKATASNGIGYDQAVYLDKITYTYHSNTLVGGVAREVRFLRQPRSDWTDTTATTTASFHEQEYLDRIEVWVGTDLVRRYVLSFDYSIDRDPTSSWQGGATGDLTLTGVTQVGSDGNSTLPPLTFTYNASGRLQSVTNGIGGTVTFAYERVTTVPLYSLCFRQDGNGTCLDRGASTNTADNVLGSPTQLGHIVTGSTPPPGTLSLYTVCLAASGTECTDRGASTTPTDNILGSPLLLGYLVSTPVPGTVLLYSACVRNDGATCLDQGVSTTATGTLRGSLYVVKVDRYRVTRREASAGQGSPVATTHTYWDLGLGGPDNKEFWGHARAQTVDPLGNYANTWFHQDEALKGKQFVAETRRRSTGDLFTQVLNTWTTSNPFPETTFARLTRAEVRTCEGTSSCRRSGQTFEYDNTYGNPTRVVYLGDLDFPGNERTEITEYAPPNLTAYLVSLPARTEVRDANGATVAQSWFYYDGAAAHTATPAVGNLTQRCGWLNGGTNPCVTMTYDQYGNVLTTTDPRGFTTTTTYDMTFQTFPERVTSPPLPNVPGGLVTTATYDPKFGVVLTSTDPNGQTTTSQYDTFSRLISTTNPLGETVTTSYDSFGTVGAQRITTRLPDGSSDGLWSEEYFDGLGRTVRSRKEDSAGTVVILEAEYDARGLPWRKSLPRFESEPSVLWASTVTYDPLSRVIETLFADGTRGTTVYSVVTPAVPTQFARVTVTDRKGRTRTSVKDAYGRVVSITEPLGAGTTYGYDPMGRLKQVTDAAGNVTVLTYDTLGRKTQMAEPNMGTWSYTYDENGNLKTQTDAKGQTLTFTYDALSRIATKTYPDNFPIPYTYDTGTNGKGRLASMTDRAGTVSYIYDVLGRKTTVTRTVDGVAYASQTTYTSLGQPRTVTYPDGEVVTYTYDSGGHLFSVAGAQPYASSMTYTAAGQLATLEYGSGLTTTWTYDPLTLRLTRLQTGTDRPPTTRPLTRWSRAWSGLPHIYGALTSGGICVANSSGSCVGGDIKTTPDPGGPPTLGYFRTTASAGTLPIYFGTCYSDPSGRCLAWGLTLDPLGSLLGYLATAAPDTQSAAAPLTQSGGLLLQGLGLPPSAYLWTSQSVATTLTPHTDHLYVSDSSTPSGYTAEGTTTYLHPSAEPGTLPLSRYIHPGTGHHYYSTANDPPTGFVLEATLGYLHAAASSALVPLNRFFNPTTGDYLLDTTSAPPSGYTLQATLGYAHATSPGPVLQDFSYDPNEVGSLRSITDNRTPANSQSFQYDDLDRLRTATGPYGTHTYDYNLIGNITNKAGVSYTYGATAQTCNRLMPHAVTSTSNGKSYTYDCNGNLLSDGERTLTWDVDNKPVSVTRTGVGTTTFVYSGDGARLKKVGPTKTIRYLGAYEDHVSEGAQIKQIMAGPVRVATRVTGGPNAGTYFIHGDHLGGLNVLTTSRGAEVQRLTYLPYGETFSNTGTVDFHARRYTGQIQDPETGLYYYNARYYDPVLGRFLSPDSIVPNAGDSQALNRYSYVRNNPVNLIDPSGHGWLSKTWNKVRNYIRRHQTLATILGVAGQIYGWGGGSFWKNVALGGGTALLTQTETGRYIIAGEIIIATAVATWYCGGCGASTLAALKGALAGELVGGALGGYSAARFGGDISQGVLFGTVVGGITGAAGGHWGSMLQSTIAKVSADTLMQKIALAFAYVGKGIEVGTILGAGSGAIVGYAGGAGDWDAILKGAGQGAVYGAMAGAVTGGLDFAFNGLHLNLVNLASSAEAKLAVMVLEELNRFGVLYSVPQALVGIEMMDHNIQSEIEERIRRRNFSVSHSWTWRF